MRFSNWKLSEVFHGSRRLNPVRDIGVLSAQFPPLTICGAATYLLLQLELQGQSMSL